MPESKILEPSSTSEGEDDHDEVPGKEHGGDDDDNKDDNDDDDEEDYDSSESENKGTSDDKSTVTSPEGWCYVGIFS